MRRLQTSDFRLLCAALWLLSASAASAALLDNFPTPAGGKPAAEHRVNTPYGEGQVTQFLLPGAAPEVLEAYRRTLLKSGWTLEREVPQAGSAIFSRHGTLLIVAAKELQPKKTLLVLSRAARPAGMGGTSRSLSPDEVARLQQAAQRPIQEREPAGIPRYPASRMLAVATGKTGAQTFRYESDEAAEDILDFYRSRLESGGWRITGSRAFDDPAFRARLEQAAASIQNLEDLAGGTVSFEGASGRGFVTAAGAAAQGPTIIMLFFKTTKVRR